MNEIYAKSNPEEILEVHTGKVIKEFKNLKQLYLNNDFYNRFSVYIEKILGYHDSGKANLSFQNRIRKLNRRSELKQSVFDSDVPHEILSLSFISNEDYEFFESFREDDIDFYDLAMYCIGFHHHRKKTFSKKEIDAVLQEMEDNRGILGITGQLTPFYDMEGLKRKIEQHGKWEKYFRYVCLFKGLLHKCDYCASSGLPAETQFSGNYREQFLSGLKKRNIEKLKDYQEEAENYSDKNVILIASTGAGKTEYSMKWINGRKAFYLLGLKTAVNAMYERFREIFTDKNVSILHGENIYILAEQEGKEESLFKKNTKARNLSFPITVATADQLVPSVFKFPGFEFYYFTASYSKIVIDEIQSFSSGSIAAIVVFLKEIVRLGGKYLLMTATLPPFVKQELEKETGNESYHFVKHLSSARRHVLKLSENTLLSDEAYSIISSALAEKKKVLVVANTVRTSTELYSRLESLDPQLLNSRFIRKDRKEKEKRILSQEEGPCLWISTQIVEASLDIDFDVLLTENATVDALFQRFGRIWRKREYTLTVPNIFLFKPEDDEINNIIYDKDISAKTREELLRYNNSIITEEDKQRVIENVFSDIENTLYFRNYKKYKDLLTLGFRAESRNEAEKLFREIVNNYSVIPETVYDENKEEIDSVIEFIHSRNPFEEKLKKKAELLEYCASVQVYRKQAKELLYHLYLPDGSIFDDMEIYLLKGCNYSSEKGVEFIKDYKDRSNFID